MCIHYEHTWLRSIAYIIEFGVIKMSEVIIIGSGPAGLTAAIYCARAALKPIVVAGGQVGGQLTTTTVIENWPGFVEGIDGPKLMQDMQKQAEHVGAEFIYGSVLKIEKVAEHKFKIHLDNNTTLETKAVIVATGASAITLPLPKLKELMGYGISTCAVCDGFFYRGKPVAIIGGGDSAMEEATYLSKMCSSVTLVHRRDKFRASKAMQDRVLANPKINIIYNTEVVDTESNEHGLTAVVLQNNDGAKTILPVDGLFMVPF